jgi:type IV secretory pathway TrbD component
MTHTEPIPGWLGPVYQSLAQPMLTAGVPSDFFMMSMVTTLACSLAWWPAWIVQAGVYALAKRLTAWDPLWMGILWRYLQYATRYEG